MVNAFVRGQASMVTIKAATRQAPAAGINAGSAQVTAICQSIATVGSASRISASASPCWATSEGDRTGRRAAASCIPIQRTAAANLSPGPLLA